ncbi:MBL fold metallo-hydrolase [Streptacidiphilus sp. EB129]|uniref:MBL fold metallo-hydrolase n=1 Tax=Streptacidiphilus sp. EB129 TaxID=3156262 RepID=UPI0035149428
MSAISMPAGPASGAVPSPSSELSPSSRVHQSSGLSVHRLGDHLVNFYLVEAGSALVLVDAGLPAHWDALLDAVRTLGRRPTDIAAVLVTHGHPDHIGLAERVRAVSGAQVWVHESDAPILAAPRRLSKVWQPERSLLRYAVRRPIGLRAPLHLARGGALRVPAVRELHTFRDDRRLEVPGRPLAMHTPGHTHGSTTFLFPQASVAFTGDALVTRDSVAGRSGPCVICQAFTQDSQAALASLDRMAEHDIDTVLPGHGDPWTRGLTSAAHHATAAGIR